MSDVHRLLSLMPDWTGGAAPAFERLAQAIATVIETGQLDGRRLPAERGLAQELRISRATVARAYKVLADRGLATVRGRSGTVVRPLGRRKATVHYLPAVASMLVDAAQDLVDLSVGSPALDDLVVNVSVETRSARALVRSHGYEPQGLQELRMAIAARQTARGAPTQPDEVLVTSGAQQALSLVVALLAGRGQAVGVEAPTYAGALEVLERHGARSVSLAGDVAGVTPEAMHAALVADAIAWRRSRSFTWP